MPTQREARFKRRLLKHLQARGGYWVSIHGEAMQTPTLDILGCYRGHFVGIETKCEKGGITRRQAFVLGEIIRADGDAIIVRDVFDEADALLDALDRLKKD